MTESLAELFAALASVQAELPTVDKNKTADAGSYKYKYADLADVIEAAKPILSKHGLAFTAFPQHIDGKFGLNYVLGHKSGANLGGFWEIDDTGGMQKIGGRITYARRYCFSSALNIAVDEDTDAHGDADPAQAIKQRVGRRGKTDEQLAAEGQMTRQQKAEHDALEREVKGTGPQGIQRSTEPSTDDPWTLPPPADQDYDTPGTVTRSQLNKIHAQFGEMGFTPEQRAERLKAASRITGRELKSANDLSFNEAKALVKRIEDSGTDWTRLDAELGSDNDE